MKNIKYSLISLAFFGLISCSVEKPFDGPQKTGFGEFSKYAMDLDVSVINGTRATTQDILNDCDIVIQKPGTPSVTVVSYKYKDMPDIVKLDAGSYVVKATYGENHDAAFENPYYLGESVQFDIEPNKITTDIGTIECKLENVKVSINFHSSLYEKMDDNAYVEVYVNKEASLKFKKDETKAGYFKHSDVRTLTATFHGVIDGVELNEVKTLSDIDKGNHYSLTFSSHEYSQDSTNGAITPSISVSAKVTIENINENITIEEDKILDNSERPKEEDPSTGGDPSDPEDPEDPEDPDENSIEIFEVKNPDPEGNQIDLDKINYVDGNSFVALKVICPNKIKNFYVSIKKPLADFLDDILPAEFDLAHPDEEYLTAFRDDLQLIGEGLDSLYDQEEVEFNVTKFMPVLCMIPDIKGQVNEFVIQVIDQNEDEKTVSLKLVP